MNRLGKLRPEVIALWARILQAVPDARLIVKAAGWTTRRAASGSRTRSTITAPTSRLQFRGVTAHATHLKTFNEIDVNLDPWLDGGGVTTLDATWMGVLSVTFPYRQIASRLTASFNNELGLPFLNATSPRRVRRAGGCAEQPAPRTGNGAGAAARRAEGVDHLRPRVVRAAC